jgi:hypothetical protein
MGLFNRKKRLSTLLDDLPDAMGGGGVSDRYGIANQPAYHDQGSYGDPSAGDVGGPPQHKGFNWGRAALGFLGGPGVAEAFQRKDELELQRQRFQEVQQQHAEAQAQMQQIYHTIDNDPGLSPQDRAYAKMNPKGYVENYLQRFKPFDNGPQGGSRGLPGPDGQIGSYQVAPRTDENGSMFGPTTYGVGQDNRPPPVIQPGTKIVPLQQGGTAPVFNAVTGAPMTNGQMRQRAEGSTAPPGQSSEAALRAQAEEAIRNGADPAAVNARLQALLNGGAGPAAARGGFLRKRF